MEHSEFKNAPWLGGWAIATALGVVFAGAGYVAMGLSGPAACAAGIVVLLLAGLVLDFPAPKVGGGEASSSAPGPAERPSLRPVASPAPLMSAPATARHRPAGLDVARGGSADDLKKIKGIGPQLEALCHSLGFFHFDQIAAWTPAEIAWVDENLEGFKGRVTRDEWVAQARTLAAGGETEFSRRVNQGDVY